MAKSEEELQALKEEKEALMSKIKELSDDELKQISGGQYDVTLYFEKESDAYYVHNIGDLVEVYNGWLFGTVQCRIKDRRVVWYETNNTGGPGIYALNVSGYRDEYLVEEVYDHWYFYLNKCWVPRDDIEI